MPWELAYLDEPLDPAAPHFLAAQTYMGRWLDDQNVMLPPAVEVEIERLTAVAARYGLGTSQRELLEAIAEQEMLRNRWKAIVLEAKKPDVTPVLSGSRVPGHLIHFAVHGVSDPDANHQAILPRGDYLKRLNTSQPNSTQYYALAANFTPAAEGLLARFSKRIADKVVDGIFGEENDGVVPTRGSYESEPQTSGFPVRPEHRVVFEKDDQIHHCNYFANERSNKQILEWVARTGQ